MSLEISFACNDHRNGNFTGYFEAANVTHDGDYIEFECSRTRIEWVPADRQLHIGKGKVPYISHRPWVGNWCWDEFVVSAQACAQILDYLRAKRWAHCIGGPCGLFERFNDEWSITVEEIIKELDVLCTK